MALKHFLDRIKWCAHIALFWSYQLFLITHSRTCMCMHFVNFHFEMFSNLTGFAVVFWHCQKHDLPWDHLFRIDFPTYFWMKPTLNQQIPNKLSIWYLKRNQWLWPPFLPRSHFHRSIYIFPVSIFPTHLAGTIPLFGYPSHKSSSLKPIFLFVDASCYFGFIKELWASSKSFWSGLQCATKEQT